MHSPLTNTLSLTLSLFLTCLFIHTAFAQSSISGTLKNQQKGTPVHGATLSFLQNSLHDHSNVNGKFSFRNVRLPDSLRISSVGYRSKTIYVKDSAAVLQILIEEAPLELEQVTIMGNPLLASQIMKLDVDKTPINSAQDVLRKVPGLFIAQHAGGGKAEQIFLRGFDNDHGTDISIQVDGMPVNMVSHAHGQGYADLHFIIPETIDDIAFGKGAYYADKGNFNTSGYVALSTLNQLNKSLLKVEGGSFGTARTLLMLNLLPSQDKPSTHPANAYLAADYNYTNGPFDHSQNFNRINLFGKYTQQINNNTSFGFQVSTFSSSWDASGQIPERAVESGLIGRFGSFDPTEGGNTSRSNVAFTYDRQPTESSFWSSKLFYSRYTFDLFSNFTFFLNDDEHGDQIHQKEDRNIYGFQTKYNKEMSWGSGMLHWTAGLDLRFDDIQNTELSSTYRRNELIGRKSWGSGTESNLSGYSSLAWKKDKWTVEPGLRLDYFIFNYHDKLVDAYAPSNSVKATRLSPKFNTYYHANNNVDLYLKTGMGFHSNDMRVVMFESGKKTLPYSLGSDLGAVVKLHPTLLMQAAIWYLYLQDELVYVGDEAVIESAGETQRYGMDIGFRYQPISWFYLDADLNYARPRALHTPPEESYIPLAPTLTSTGGASIQLPNGFSSSLRYRYIKDRPGNEDNSVLAKGYFVNDLLLSYRLSSFAFHLQAQNLFNVNWREAQFYTETKLRGEAQAFSDMAFTPGTPLFIKLGIAYHF